MELTKINKELVYPALTFRRAYLNLQSAISTAESELNQFLLHKEENKKCLGGK